jgi:hypothetical protein
MKYIIRKFVEAGTVQEAIRKDRKTPVHDCYLKEGESQSHLESAIGFSLPAAPDDCYELRRKR